MMSRDRSEPALVPEWLTSNGNSTHHFATFSSNSDASTLLHHGRHRNSRNISALKSPRSAILDRAYSLSSGRSPRNGSSKHAYSSFNRSHRDNDRERDKERTSFRDNWDRDSSDTLVSILTSRAEIDTLRHSHSMVYRKQGEPLPRRIAVDSRDNGKSNHNIGIGLHSGGTLGSSIHKALFEKDFPSLGTEERQGVPEMARAPFPGLSSASQSLPVGNSALIDGEEWTSALAEVSSVVGSSSTSSLSAPQIASTSGCGAPTPSISYGLNMAEALAQAPLQTRTAPLLSVKTQRREELAIKQSRQLIPVTPSMPKGSVLNSADKSKARPAVRISETNIVVKSGLQPPPLIHQGNHSPHSEHVKSDMPKTSGKLLVLKHGWDNGVSSHTRNDIASPTTITNNRVTTSKHVAPVKSASTRNLNSPKLSAGERKAAASNPIAGFTVEKRPSLAQTKSRNDFFNLLKKKKTSTNTFSGLSDSGPHISSSNTENSEATKEVDGASATAHAGENGTAATSNGDTSDDGEKNMSAIAMVYPDEEEAAFLRSLGWVENTGEDEGLTEEEINDFYQEYKKSRPSLKLCHGMQTKLSQSFANSFNGASSELTSFDSMSEA